MITEDELKKGLSGNGKVFALVQIERNKLIAVEVSKESVLDAIQYYGHKEYCAQILGNGNIYIGGG